MGDASSGSTSLEALDETDWNIARAAARLRIPRGTLRYRIEKLGLRRNARSPARAAPAAGPRRGIPPTAPPPARVRRGAPAPGSGAGSRSCEPS